MLTCSVIELFIVRCTN